LKSLTQTALLLLASPMGLLPSLLPIEKELLQPPDVGTAVHFQRGCHLQCLTCRSRKAKQTQPSVL